jgi:hypothetical protein
VDRLRRGGLRWRADTDEALAPLAAERCLTDDRSPLGSAAVPPAFHPADPARDAVPWCGWASWAPYTPIETSLLQRLVPAEVRGQVFGARHSLVVAATPLGFARTVFEDDSQRKTPSPPMPSR